MKTRPKQIVNLADVPLTRHAHGATFENLDATVAEHVGAQQLGYALNVIPPGKRCWPFHAHRVNEEMVLVLDGEGTVRIGAERFSITKGDVIAFVAGGPETAHQLINTGSADLRVLAVSTMHPSEVVEYPDSGKVLVRAGTGFTYRGRLGAPASYWDGEQEKEEA